MDTGQQLKNKPFKLYFDILVSQHITGLRQQNSHTHTAEIQEKLLRELAVYPLPCCNGQHNTHFLCGKLLKKQLLYL